MGKHPIVSLTADKVGRKTNAVVDGEQMPTDFKQRCAVDNLLSFPFFSLSVSLPINYTPGTRTRVREIHQPSCGSPRYGSMAPIDT